MTNGTASQSVTEDIEETTVTTEDLAQNTNNNDESVTKRLGDVKLSSHDSEILDNGKNMLPLNDECDRTLTDNSVNERKQVTFIEPNGSPSKNMKNSDSNLLTNNGLTVKKDFEQVYDVKVLQNIAEDNKAVLSDQELLNLHLRVNIFHFLLPGLCHMTADDIPREILLNCGALGLLDLYMWKQWENFLKMPANREIQVSAIMPAILLRKTGHTPEFSRTQLLTG